ncbi:hypothetical protein LTR97_009063 [Elasticomyces elasticus]|uniref:Fungal N-terminal domain-containing protein n=1 Tax=Elasticomyces elasticus TaxID=574655 RepID=A0AAN7ZSF6_9PEZI|nr:hypothetical protein LTR97_009063 [Elasticomyces elasticus]
MAAFGFSVGDFVTGIQLLYDIIQCLEDSAGSQAQYRGVALTLRGLRLALRRAKACTSDVNDRMAIGLVVKDCETTLKRFESKLQKYETPLGGGGATSNGSSSIKARWRKIQWQLYSKKDVQAFQHEITAHVGALSVTMASIGL